MIAAMGGDGGGGGETTDGEGRAPGSLPRFFLEGPPEDGHVRMVEGESEHALRVLRMRPGQLCEGLDGAGGRWRLRIVAAGRHDLGLEVLGPPAREPEPGAPGAPLPWIELDVSWPRRARAEEMLTRLVQLGAAAIRPLDALQRGAGQCPREPSERWWRIARESCKQSGRAWLPLLGARTTPQALVFEHRRAAIALLDPHRGMSLDTWVRSLPCGGEGLGTRERPIVLAIGPEGGFAPDELDAFLDAGATTVRLTPFVLRVETAAEAALAVTATILAR